MIRVLGLDLVLLPVDRSPSELTLKPALMRFAEAVPGASPMTFGGKQLNGVELGLALGEALALPDGDGLGEPTMTSNS